MVKELLQVRAYCLQYIREFFILKGYLEVETPLLAPALIPEACLEVFTTNYVSPDTTAGAPEEYYLIPSPEVWMKRLLAGGIGSIFQLTKCFRNVESKGKYHNPEFTMLEWYSVGHDYRDEMLVTEELLGFLLEKLAASYVPGRSGGTDTNRPETGGTKIGGTNISGTDIGGTNTGGTNTGKKTYPVLPAVQECLADVSTLAPPFVRLSMQEACLRYAHFDLAGCSEQAKLYEVAKRLDLAVNRDDTWEEVFNKIFLTLVEPELPVARPVILYDYPAQIPTLARQKGFFSERWELYIKGVEIANCFTEETDREKVAGFIAEEDARKKMHCRIQHRPDLELAAYFGLDYPGCSGVALGIDRLLMVLLNLKSIKDIMLSAFVKD